MTDVRINKHRLMGQHEGDHVGGRNSTVAPQRVERVKIGVSDELPSRWPDGQQIENGVLVNGNRVNSGRVRLFIVMKLE